MGNMICWTASKLLYPTSWLHTFSAQGLGARWLQLFEHGGGATGKKRSTFQAFQAMEAKNGGKRWENDWKLWETMGNYRKLWQNDWIIFLEQEIDGNTMKNHRHTWIIFKTRGNKNPSFSQEHDVFPWNGTFYYGIMLGMYVKWWENHGIIIKMSLIWRCSWGDIGHLFRGTFIIPSVFS